jgi:hypothetical protein
MRPGAPISAAEVMQLIQELPEDSATVASLAAKRSPDGDSNRAGEPAVVTAFRRARRYRGWTADRRALFDIRDGLVGKPSPRPWDIDGVAVSDRRVVELIPI